ncbi:RNase adapter RapZ [Williamsia sterculiae]|uniref:UPF0042 nucleotide-binding protein n=1 Tax=Williamsia sterculiae TaxID=1344003 RepID=A0A1N7EIK1_9NOCA|nr:RNase adapter RapZ [Williamsia sterculiae]SIR87951.1 UPF0042 nucleotide-binding protein [Williamsia sterculiae]
MVVESDAADRPVTDAGTVRPRVEVLLVTGVSGAGRGTAAKLLEDAGWYVADNVPAGLVVDMARVAEADGSITRLATVMRAAGPSFTDDFTELRDELERNGFRPRVMFIDADDQVLVRRFEQVRRQHPLQGHGTLTEGIAAERAILAPIKDGAHQVVDTSTLAVSALREIVDEVYADESRTRISLVLESFGFKYGLPIDADLVADVRFLPNPYWVPELRNHNGRDAPVRDYVLGQAGADEFVDTYEKLVRITARGYRREGKRYMTVGIGCTGGKHRSVAIVEEVANRLRSDLSVTAPEPEDPDAATFTVRVVHRDLGRE